MNLYAALEVKGGEGNSINISDRPLWAKEFGLWCHLSGAIVNQPAHGALAIINRITNELVRRGKIVDVVFFKDILCGTKARPCPKYPGKEAKIGIKAAPDIFLFPKEQPIYSFENSEIHNPEPEVHTIKSLKLPEKILSLYNIPKQKFNDHIWYVKIEIQKAADDKIRRRTKIIHNGMEIFSSVSRPWHQQKEN